MRVLFQLAAHTITKNVLRAVVQCDLQYGIQNGCVGQWMCAYTSDARSRSLSMRHDGVSTVSHLPEVRVERMTCAVVQIREHEDNQRGLIGRLNSLE